LVRDLSLIPDTNLPASLHHNASVQHEASLIGAFVKRNKRERYREMLSNPRQRHKFISLLAHFLISIPNTARHYLATSSTPRTSLSSC
jgi:hypothetical protein